MFWLGSCWVGYYLTILTAVDPYTTRNSFLDIEANVKMLTRQMGQPDITSHCLWNATKSEGGSIYSIITRITTETKPISVKKVPRLSYMIIVGIQWEMWWVPYKERYVKCGQQWAWIAPKNSCIYSSLTTWSHYTVHIYLYQTVKLFKVETKYCKKNTRLVEES